MSDEFILGLIPARGGSKGVPAKNIRLLGGKPLIEHTIAAAAGARHLSDWFVTTDSEQIAEVARRAGASVPFLRPAELATDTAKVIDAVRHAVLAYEQTNARRVTAVVLLQPTCPMRNSADIDAAIECFRAAGPGVNSLITLVRVQSGHPYYMYRRDGVRARPLFEGIASVANRQDFPEIYLREGSIYIATRQQALSGERIFDERPAVYEMPPDRAVNIDTIEDFRYAEFIMTRSVPA
jgi:CMP-N,N'-diacetyllegionaminic acid synthase